MTRVGVLEEGAPASPPRRRCRRSARRSLVRAFEEGAGALGHGVALDSGSSGSRRCRDGVPRMLRRVPRLATPCPTGRRAARHRAAGGRASQDGSVTRRASWPRATTPTSRRPARDADAPPRRRRAGRRALRRTGPPGPRRPRRAASASPPWPCRCPSRGPASGPGRAVGPALVGLGVAVEVCRRVGEAEHEGGAAETPRSQASGSPGRSSSVGRPERRPVAGRR